MSSAKLTLKSNETFAMDALKLLHNALSYGAKVSGAEEASAAAAAYQELRSYLEQTYAKVEPSCLTKANGLGTEASPPLEKLIAQGAGHDVGLLQRILQLQQLLLDQPRQAVEAVGVSLEHVQAESIQIHDVIVQITKGDQPPTPGEPPYKGLKKYDVEDSQLFFGRERLTAELVGHLRTHSFLAVIGASGSGKSSLVRAGVVAALKKGDPLLDGSLPPRNSHLWPDIIITPTERPLENLADHLIRTLQLTETSTSLARKMIRDGNALAGVVQKALDSGSQVQPDGVQPRLLLVVDQFEELFTRQRHEQHLRALPSDAGRQAFIENLLLATRADGPTSSPVVVVIALRADYYDRCASFEILRLALEHEQRFIGPLTKGELARIVHGPLEKNGWTLDPLLTQQILWDIGTEPGALPLLSHALLATWERRSGRNLTLAGYLSAGGIRGAIAKSAQSLYERECHSPADQRLIRNIFLRLTELSSERTDTRRRVFFSAFQNLGPPDKIKSIVDELTEANLITVGRETKSVENGGSKSERTLTVLQVSHEALIREWPLLRAWLEENREAEKTRRRLENLAREGLLLTRAHISSAEEWLKDAESREIGIDPEIRNLIRQSRDAIQSQEQARARALRREGFLRKLWISAVALAIFALIAGISAFLGFVESRRATIAERRASTLVLAAGSVNKRTDSPELGMHLAVEAVQRSRVEAPLQELLPITDNALRTQFDQWQYWQRGLTGHVGSVRALRFGAQTNRLFSGGNDGKLMLWDWHRREKPILEVVDLGVAVRSMTYDSLRKMVHVGTGDGQIITFADGDPLTRLGSVQAHAGSAPLAGLAIAPDHQTLLSASSAGELKQWALSARGSPTEAIQVRNLAGAEVTDLTWRKDGRWVAVASNEPRMLQLWQLDPTGTLAEKPSLQHYSAAGIRAVSFSPDKRWLLAGDGGGNLLAWDLNESQSEPSAHRIDEVASDLWALVAHPSENLIATGSESGRVGVLQLVVDEGLLTVRGSRLGQLEGRVEALAFDRSGRFLTTGSGDGSVHVWSLTAIQSEPARIPARSLINEPQVQHKAGVRSVAFAPPNDSLAGLGRTGILATADVAGKIQIWSVGSEIEHLQTVTQPEAELRAVALSRDGKWLAGGALRESSPLLWSTADLLKPAQPLTGENTGVGVLTVAFSADSQWLAAGGDRGVCLHQMSDPVPCRVHLGDPLTTVLSVAFSSDGRFLATGDDFGQILLWNLTNPVPGYETIVEREHWPRALAVSDDGHHIAVAFEDAVVLYDLENRQPRSLGSHGLEATAVAFSPNGLWLASTGADQLVALHSLNRSHEPIVLRGHTAPVRTLAFSPDSQKLASAGDDQTVLVWTVSTEELIRRGCERSLGHFPAGEAERYLKSDSGPHGCAR